MIDSNQTLDLTLFKRRKAFIDTLFDKARNSELSQHLALEGNTAVLTSYCPLTGAEDCEPRVDTHPSAKSLAWARGPGLSVEIKTKVREGLVQSVTSRKPWHDFATINGLWEKVLVGSATVPPYRLTNIQVRWQALAPCLLREFVMQRTPLCWIVLQGAKYCSSVCGEFLVRYALNKASAVQPSTDFALYSFGALMTSQPFPDGNKRAARALYVLIMDAAGAAWAAPSNGYGATLADM